MQEPGRRNRIQAGDQNPLEIQIALLSHLPTLLPPQNPTWQSSIACILESCQRGYPEKRPQSNLLVDREPHPFIDTLLRSLAIRYRGGQTLSNCSRVSNREPSPVCPNKLSRNSWN